jgi:hypothetical protein
MKQMYLAKERMFFFEKKNQKTFARLVPRQLKPTRQAATAQEQKFFASFFQKRSLPSYFPTISKARA